MNRAEEAANVYKVVIRGVGAYVPKNRLTNEDLEKMVETSDEWIRSRTGIAARRIADESEATSDLAYHAAVSALADAQLEPGDIDLILVATETPDHIFPPVACQVQHRLGCRTVGAMDVHTTCVGFLSALQIAEQYLKSGTHQHILVIGADTLSRFTDYTDRTTCILFADGAGAFVLSRTEDEEQKGIIATSIHSNGEHFGSLYIPGGGSRHPNPVDEQTKAKIVMDGRKIFKLAVSVLSEVADTILENAGYAKEALDWVIPHQANQRIIDAVAERVDIPKEKFISTIQQYGNNSSATIPLAFHTAIQDGRIQRGDQLLLVSFGAGLVWGGTLLQY